MIRVSTTGILLIAGAVLFALGILAAIPPRSWEPACRATLTYEHECLTTLVRLELAQPNSTIDRATLMDWCQSDQLCRIDVLNGRPSGDMREELALCQVWTPDYTLTCEQGVTARYRRSGALGSL